MPGGLPPGRARPALSVVHGARMAHAGFAANPSPKHRSPAHLRSQPEHRGRTWESYSLWFYFDENHERPQVALRRGRMRSCEHRRRDRRAPRRDGPTQGAASLRRCCSSGQSRPCRSDRGAQGTSAPTGSRGAFVYGVSRRRPGCVTVLRPGRPSWVRARPNHTTRRTGRCGRGRAPDAVGAAGPAPVRRPDQPAEPPTEPPGAGAGPTGGKAASPGTPLMSEVFMAYCSTAKPRAWVLTSRACRSTLASVSQARW